ncbi:MAG: hypothetical protein J5732_00820 [Bacteroidaceae bacterium]|nr:hypothetical protein [Bacteroidaceae bacterium]
MKALLVVVGLMAAVALVVSLATYIAFNTWTELNREEMAELRRRIEKLS